ncbi:DUF4336 domain-containing protein [Anabaena azotica]|uniref:DUF4336 domain-containing protein n=1 Tax=Anabaena azotica FACHB-119 TaxID=947527 RepID=A0ABR8DDB9_9NOST|nr:DUF4336 domain-containing protein [Anabaena azotica]MBD2504961.1 DUF4336 domain-containing protein [Anabaena azotica FACHB-119]
MNSQIQSQNNPQDWSWPFWPALPLYPYGRRRTVCREIVKDTIWTFDQVQGILYTVVPIRMSVIRLNAGGLLVYAPVAPTKECVRLVNELVAKYGEVKYIILPTSSGLEHKIFVGPFARKFPQAQVFVAPHQWSFPFNLPLSWLGFPQKRTQTLPEDSRQTPFADEFDYAVLDINLGRGAFVEVAFLHRRSHTLLVTDSVLSVSAQPPTILQLEPYPLLFHARDNASQAIEDTPANRRQGWQRIALFALYFRPSAIELSGFVQMWREALKAPDHSPKAYFGFFPFRWRENWQQSFTALSANGRPFVAPILQILILPQAPTQVRNWADTVAKWDFQQIIACHFDAPFAASPEQFRQAFNFLDENANNNHQTLLAEDLKFIQELEADLPKNWV